MAAKFRITFRTGYFHDLCRVLLGNDDRNNEATIGSRWWHEAIDSHAIDDDPDSDRVGGITINSGEELWEFFARLADHNTEAHAAKAAEDFGGPSVLTARNLGLGLSVSVEDGPYRAFASVEDAGWGRNTAHSEIRRGDAGPELRAAIAKVQDGLAEIERLA